MKFSPWAKEKFLQSEVFRFAQSEVFCVSQKVVADINNGNNLPERANFTAPWRNFTVVANFTVPKGITSPYKLYMDARGAGARSSRFYFTKKFF